MTRSDHVEATREQFDIFFVVSFPRKMEIHWRQSLSLSRDYSSRRELVNSPLGDFGAAFPIAIVPIDGQRGSAPNVARTRARLLSPRGAFARAFD
jgi:hypothetical protein